MANIINFVPSLSLAEQKSTLDRMGYLAHEIKRRKALLKRLLKVRAPKVILDNEKGCIAKCKGEYAVLFDKVENKGMCDEYINLQARQLGRMLGLC